MDGHRGTVSIGINRRNGSRQHFTESEVYDAACRFHLSAGLAAADSFFWLGSLQLV